VTLIFVLPRFTAFFASLRIELPFQTRLVLAASHMMIHYGWLIALVLIGGGMACWRYVHTEQGRLRWDRELLRLPVLGKVFLHLGMSRFARTVSALTGSGIPVLETLALAGQSVNNEYIQQGLVRVSERVKGGEALSTALKTDHLFPPIVIQMVATGEETGRMDELLHSVSDYYDQQVTYLVWKLLTYVEPALLLVVGGGVLLMATSILVPMWDLVKLFKQGG
jgi:MSHA biogenesis protein MshG